MSFFKRTFDLFKKAAILWSDDSVSIHGAALSYYTLFSVAPLLLLAIAISGLFFGAEASRGQIFNQLQGLLGQQGASSVEGLVQSAAQKPHSGIVATIIGFVTLLLGASGVFQQLQESLNLLWRVTTKPGKGVWVFLRRRLLTFSMVAVIGFLLLISLVVGAAIAAAGKYLGGHLPGGEAFWQIINIVFSFGVTMMLFAAVLKILPDVELEWRDVWLSAGVTALLFTIGKFLIGLYLGHASISSSFGAAGSLVVVLVWVFYASQILYFGVEFTRAYVASRNKKVSPKAGALLIPNNDPGAPKLDKPEKLSSQYGAKLASPTGAHS